MEKGIQEQEKELIDGWRKLGPESKRLVMSTVITAVTAESAVKRHYGLSEEAVSQFADGEVE